MADNSADSKTIRTTCDGCGGSGQISFFRGVSRFVMDWDDCPDCLGTGSIETPASDTAGNTAAPIEPESDRPD